MVYKIHVCYKFVIHNKTIWHGRSDIVWRDSARNDEKIGIETGKLAFLRNKNVFKQK